jgi:hypothetical protein
MPRKSLVAGLSSINGWISKKPNQYRIHLLREERSAGGSNGAPPEVGWLAVARVLLNLDETITRE